MSTYWNMTAANCCNHWLQEGIHQQSTAHRGENKTKKHETFRTRKEKQKKTINSRINLKNMSTYQNMTTANCCNCQPQEGIHQQSTTHGRENKTKKHETFGMRKEKQKKKQSTAE